MRPQPLFALLLVLIAATQPLYAEEAEEPWQWSFVPGRFLIVGRAPDNGPAYAGTARIERIGNRIRLTRSVDGKRSQAFGEVRRADPGEAYVLAFAWGKRQPMEMVCVIGSDLDNYPRLTCHWGKAGNPHALPGMEAYFAREPWDPVKP